MLTYRVFFRASKDHCWIASSVLHTSALQAVYHAMRVKGEVREHGTLKTLAVYLSPQETVLVDPAFEQAVRLEIFGA